MSDDGTRVAESSGTNGKVKKTRGIVCLDPSRCKGCGFCIAFCPPHVLEFSEEFNSQGYHPPRLSNPEGCTGCDLCGLYCPDFAIYGLMLKYRPEAQGQTERASSPQPAGATEGAAK
jgi:2-oxoglutarate ferredoxin oxidoreductase subunit delta